MADISQQDVIDKLKEVPGPDLESNIVALGMVSRVVIENTKVMFSITVPSKRARELETLRLAAERAVRGIDGVDSVMVVLTAERSAEDTSTSADVRPLQSKPTMQRANRSANLPKKEMIPGVKAIIMVASGKGGVGKSTTSVNLALGLQERGKRVGILDADIYGPSLPRLLGTNVRPEVAEGRILKPPGAYGLKVMSMGFLVEEEAPMIWRGPMVMSALKQMLKEVEWGELDALVVDMPPGTGDAQLTMVQQVPITGAVIVSTPQDLALIDARKALNMFRKVEVPILGIIENMSLFVCPKCGEVSNIFGHGGAEQEAGRVGVPFLGRVPLHMDIRRHSDEGTPVMVSDSQGVHAGFYKEIAQKLDEQLCLETS